MRDVAERLAAALVGRYVIDREIGHGGMATVHLARDTRHDRVVAIKVLRSGGIFFQASSSGLPSTTIGPVRCETTTGGRRVAPGAAAPWRDLESAITAPPRA